MDGEMKSNLATTGAGGRAPLRASILGVTLLMLLWWGGCSVENNYEFLSKIFDGVPDPNAPEMFNGQSIVKSSTYSVHKPYTDDACIECHKDPTSMLISKDDSSICMSCHAEIHDQYAYMHGAVTGNACLKCHNPHLSALSYLLRENGPGMCLQCHEFDTESVTPSHMNLDRSCTDCHSGHGGEVPFFLTSHSLSDEDLSEEAGAVDSQEGAGSDEP